MQGMETNSHLYRNDEIDLVELAKGLWQQKLIIILITALVAAIAVIYALLARPVYEAKATVLPPLLSNVVAYNAGRDSVLAASSTQASGTSRDSGQEGIKQFTVEDVYAVFTRNLTSQSLRRSFFKNTYLPSLPDAERSAPYDKLWSRFNELLSIKAPDKQQPDIYEVRIEHFDPKLAAEWANELVARAAEASKEDMQRNVMSEINTRVRSAERRIASLRSTALQRRQDRIAVLQEALAVAKAVGLDTPQVTAGRTSSSDELAEFVDGSLTYMRGAKAIEAELHVLEGRVSDDPFIPELRALQEERSFLSHIEIDPDNVAVFTLDSAAELPQTPIKPRKMLIVALGVVLGGMLGVFVALVRLLVRKNRNPE